MKYVLTVKRYSWILLLCAAAIAVPAEMVAAERSPNDPDVMREARGIYNRIMSPYCPGQSLANCGSDAAERLRINIRQRLADGDSPDAIIASLVEEFGESVLAEPPNRGFGRLAWIGPIAILLGGGVVVLVYLRRHTAREDGNDGKGAVDPAFRARVEDELKTYRKS